MTFFTLARKNAWRNPVRTALLALCIAVTFLIYGLSASFVNGSQLASQASDTILGVTSAAGRSLPLPVSYMNRIAADQGVAAINYMIRLRGFVTVEKNIVAVSALDPQHLMNVNGKEFGLTQSLIDALGAGRDRVLVGRALADAQGWQEGQKITVTSPDTVKQDGSRDWSFVIGGIFDGENSSADTYFIIARYDYLNAGRARDKDTVDAFIVRPKPDVIAGELAARIDRMFANSTTPTRTQSEKQFLEAFFLQFANISLIVNLVVSVAFVTLLMIVINAMIFAMRERTFEIAVLRTFGFSRTRIMLLILGETLFIFAIGGGLGISLTKLATLMSAPALGLAFSTQIAMHTCAMVVVLGLITGALPAFKALGTPVVATLAER